MSSATTSSTATALPATRSGTAVRAGTLLDRVLQPTSLLMLLAVTVAVVGLFYRWFLSQHGHSWGNGDWSHAYLVPLISVYLIWQNREALERMEFTVFWPGLIPILMGIWTYVYFIAGVPNHFGQGLALILTVFGLTLLLLGPRAMEHLFTGIGYLIFAVTIPELVMNYLTYPLQDFAAQAGFFILRLFGVNADLSGNVINVLRDNGTIHPLNVATQCSGMRTVIAFVALGVAVALVATRQWWKRIMLLAMALPVAVLLNAIRVAILGVISLYNPKLSEGEAHMFIGTLLLVPGFFLYLAVLWSLNQAVPEPKGAKKSAKKQVRPA